MPEPGLSLPQIVDHLAIGHYHRHIFLCAGPKCCDASVGAEAWELLKNMLKDLNMSLSTGPDACFRTKVSCLRVCSEGPIVLVYPEGTWYRNMTADRIPRFIQEHLIEGRPIREWIFADNPLPSKG